jgi:DNA-binding CsgD family transcriptional regulator
LDNTRIKIAIIEPSQIVFDGLSSLLLKSHHQYSLSRFQDIEELSDILETTSFTLALINPSAVHNKSNAFLKLKKKHQNLTVIGIVYSFYDTELLNLFNDWFTISDPVRSIIQKLETLQNLNSRKEQGSEELTEREIEILTFLTKGLSNKEIADKLNISIHTVISHRKNISEKTGIKSLPGLTIYAISKNIIPLSEQDR